MLTLPNMEQRLVKIGEAAKTLGTTPGQRRKWETYGELLPTRRTRGGTRYYAMSELRTVQFTPHGAAHTGDWPVHRGRRALTARESNRT